jgi:hypothetical protein
MGPSCYLEETEINGLRPSMNLKTGRYRILFLANFLLLTLCGRLNAQVQPRSSAQPESKIQQIKKSVVFIVGNEIVNSAPRSTAGTGFLIFVPEPRLSNNLGGVWLVTCDHVIRSTQPDGSPGPYYKAVSVRYNTRVADSSGTRQFDWLQMPVLDGNGNLLWYRNPNDPSSDVAMSPINLSPEIADVKWIGTNMLLSKEEIQERAIDENDEILFTGLFDWDPGSRKNYPIVRHGKVALIPEERVPLARGPDPPTADVYLAEVMSFGGNSGSPVFVRLGGVRETPGGPVIVGTTGYSYLLLGIMKGFFPETAPVAVETKISLGVSAQNSGIAMVVPASEITVILKSPAARAWMDAAVQKELQKTVPKTP